MTPTIEPVMEHPAAIDERTSDAGLRAVASFEAGKGLLVLALMTLLLGVHSHPEDVAENLLFHLHIDADRQVSHAVMEAAVRLGDTRMVTIVLAAVSYAAVRFIEAWGLWNRRVWAEWFALLSGALYLPIEILKLRSTHWLPWTVFLINLAIVLYMLMVRLREFGAQRQTRSYTQ